MITRNTIGLGGLVLLMFLSSPCFAESLDLGGVADFIGSMAKQAKGGTAVSLSQKVSGVLYLPIWTLHDSQGTEYVSATAGGMLEEGGRGVPLVGVAFNLPAFSQRLWNFQWARDHVTRLKLPDIWLGPYIRAPRPHQIWVIGREMGGMISIGLGRKEGS